MRLRRPFVATILVAGLLLISMPGPALLKACAPAPHRGESVRIMGEAALIVWDPKTKTEHFVRRADFETSAKDFGFLVPTPTRPELGEVDESLFGFATRMTEAKHIYEKTIKTVWGFGPSDKLEVLPTAPAGDKAPSGAAVEVLDQKEVAGFDATVLKADDPRALAEWLTQHGYESRPALAEWLRWYTDHSWIITAFKLSKGGDRGGLLESKAVRMSFHADRPFYPYREPEDLRQSDGSARSLRVFFLADRKYEGTLGDDGRWPGATVWAKDVSGDVHKLTAPLKLGGTGLASSLDRAVYLTEFEDTSAPRPGTDEVYFRPAADQSALERAPIVHIVEDIQYVPGPRWKWVLPTLAPFAVIGVMALARLGLRRTMMPKPKPAR